MRISPRLILLFALLTCTSLWAQVPPIISYQGRVTVSGTNFTGAGQFKFALVDGSGSPTNTYWSNDGTSTNQPTNAVSLAVTSGLFTVMLGDTSLPNMTRPIPINAFTNLDVRLRLWFNDGTNGFRQLAPDQPITSVGYAMQSATTARALGLAPGVGNSGTVVQVNTGSGLNGGPITTSGTISIANAGVNNIMLQNSAVTVSAGSGLSGGGSVSLGGTTTLAANLVHDSSLTGNGGASALGLNLANPNTWTAPQAFQGTVSGDGAGLTNLSGACKWHAVSGAVQAAPNNGYVANDSALVTITLPASLNVGDIVRVSGPVAGGWKIAQNAGQSVLVAKAAALAVGVTWTARAGSLNWCAVASSADGTKLVALAYADQIYTSADSGVTWTARDTSHYWSSVASSADGIKLVANGNNDYIYTSTNSGVTWNIQNTSALSWHGLASSADGTRLAAVVNGGQIYISADSGVNWSARATSRSWFGVASSADGTKLVAAVNGGLIYTSTDSGTNWTGRATSRNWTGVASSTDGTKLVACANNDSIYTSTDSGMNWTPRATSRSWNGVASSADGSALVACATGATLYISTDSGLTWTSRSGTHQWSAAAASADGSKLVACAYGDQMYTSAPGLLTPSSTTTPGTAGYLTAGQNAAIELQYIGNNQFLPISYSGTIFAY